MTQHYRTRLEFTWDDSQYTKGKFSPDLLEPVVLQWLALYNMDPNALHDFDDTVAEPFSYGFTGMTSAQIIQLIEHIAQSFPEVRFYARGVGQSFGDMWLREFRNGQAVFAAGPYIENLSKQSGEGEEAEDENGKKRGWFDRLFGG